MVFRFEDMRVYVENTNFLMHFLKFGTPKTILIIFLILGLMNSKLLTPLNVLWSKFGILLGSIVAPIVMGIVFFLVITPTGFVMKIMGKDLLNKKKDNDKKSYWINRSKTKSSMKQQF